MPSHDLLKTITDSAQISLSSNRAGYSFWFESKTNSNLYYFNNTELSQVTPSRYFGAIPLYQEQEASLTGFSAIQKHFLSHPTQHVTFSIAQIDTRKLNNPSAIRIPSNFFDKLKKLIKPIYLKIKRLEVVAKSVFPRNAIHISKAASCCWTFDDVLKSRNYCCCC